MLSHHLHALASAVVVVPARRGAAAKDVVRGARQLRARPTAGRGGRCWGVSYRRPKKCRRK